MTSEGFQGSAAAALSFCFLIFSSSSNAIAISSLACESQGYLAYKGGQMRELNLGSQGLTFLFRVSESALVKDGLQGSDSSSVARMLALGAMSKRMEKSKPSGGGEYVLVAEFLQSVSVKCDQRRFYVFWTKASNLRWVPSEVTASGGTLAEVRKILDGRQSFESNGSTMKEAQRPQSAPSRESPKGVAPPAAPVAPTAPIYIENQ